MGPARRIDSVRREDVPVLMAMIRGLARYEHLEHTVTATEADLVRALFPDDAGTRVGSGPEAVLCWVGDLCVGFALFFPTFSTFVGKTGLWVEDLYVEPAHRGQGHGTALLRHVARLAHERGCGRLEWTVLEWNAPAIQLYEKLGATVLPDWRVVRMTPPALASLVVDRP